MVVAEMVGEVVGMTGERADHMHVGVADQAELVPEVLDPLSELVEVGDARLLLHGTQAPAPAPVRAMDAGADQVPAVAVEREALDPRSSG